MFAFLMKVLRPRANRRARDPVHFKDASACQTVFDLEQSILYFVKIENEGA